MLSLEIEVDLEFRAVPGFEALDGRGINADFPGILDQIRREARKEFGGLADDPAFSPN